MKDNRPALMRMFSAILKERAKAEPTETKISPEMLKHFSRKDLIEMITKIYQGKLPDELNKVETENERLMELIGDDLFIISYMTEKWCKEAVLTAPDTTAKTPPVSSAAAPATDKKEAPENKQDKKN
ncbi:MAG: hypothetical protein PSV16_11540 [Flavobacterium sp.]|nr:hypothetical protein [Flavobacterium sp.]